MFSAPFATYFVVASALDAGPIYAGVAAIITVQVVIFAYVAMAFSEDLQCDQDEPKGRPKLQ